MVLALLVAFAIALGKAQQKSKRGIQIVINHPASAKAPPQRTDHPQSALSAPVLPYRLNTDAFSNADVWVQSISDPAQKYRVNVCKQTCTCLDYVGVRAQHEPGDIRRLCKHLVASIFKDASKHTLQPHIATLLTNSHKAQAGAPLEEWKITRIAGRNVLISANKQSDWHSVVAPNTDGPGYQRYGFNSAESRWSYKREPGHAAAIIEAISIGWKYR